MKFAKTWNLEYAFENDLSLRVIIENCIKVHCNLILAHEIIRPILKSKFRETLRECCQTHIYFHRS